jgi:hypothetical protein
VGRPEPLLHLGAMSDFLPKSLFTHYRILISLNNPTPFSRRLLVTYHLNLGITVRV